MTMTPDFDVLVIGGGPGGYACAIRAAQLGLKTACVENRPTLGGTCLNVGCIPSKALLHATHLYDKAASGKLKALGIQTGEVSFDLSAMMHQKDDTVGALTKGIDFLFRKNGVTRLTGTARFTSRQSVEIDGKRVTAKSIVIATGSVPASFPGAEIDNDCGRIVDSTGALSLTRVPDRLAVIGGGVIGLELGSVWRRLGARVTVIEYMEQILPGMDDDIRSGMAKILTKQGLAFSTSTSLKSLAIKDGAVELQLQGNAGDNGRSFTADTVLIATGRRPNTAALDLAKADLSTDPRGFIPVDRRCTTAVPGIYAIGDVTPGPMLAHRAEDEGIAVAERLAGKASTTSHTIIPAVIYTDPEAASVGQTEQDLKACGTAYKKSIFPMLANSRAKANREMDGFVKILADAATDRVLGAHMVGDLAGTMIAQVAQAMEFGATSEDIAYTCHAHPTHSEAVKEAAMGIRGLPIHI
jgi:dihydrolipoamide dehydrogenase